MDRKVRILVIDDEPDLRENLKYVLNMKGYEVELAEDGVKGLHKLEAFAPDLIILDINMPNMGGIEFYQKICDGDVPKYPVFVLTARAQMEQFFRDFNVDGFMSKPFDIGDLLKEVSIVINKRIKPAVEEPKKPRYEKIFIVENNQDFASKVGAAFLMKGFTVNLARTGADGVEKITKDLPDVALVQLKLSDISGDVVVGRLKRLAKTSDVKYILYVCVMPEEESIADGMRTKIGAGNFIVVNSEADLVKAVEAL